MANIQPILELHIQEESENSQFYRYSVGDYRVWFSQKNDTGHIYNASIVPKDGDVSTDFELFADDDTRDCFYPNKFTIRGRCPYMTIEDAQKYMAAMNNAVDHLKAIKTLFLEGKHYELFCRQRIIDTMEYVDLGDYDLEGVELTDDDIDTLTRRVCSIRDVEFINTLMSNRYVDVLMPIVSEYMCEIRDVLDAGLEECENDDL